MMAYPPLPPWAQERRAVELLQPKTEPNLGGMTDAEFAAYRRSIGIG
jgi:hypothetical protein